ncbi:MAG: endonuclease [Bacteroidales bacterium]|nr:endonuclease [Bacteroidales bacterium]
MKNIKTKLLTACLICSAFTVFAVEPEGYYDAALGKSGYVLKTALHKIIKGHKRYSYSNVWTIYCTTDANADGTVRDIYTTPGCFNFGPETDGFGRQCGNASLEGGDSRAGSSTCGDGGSNPCKYCYSREHSLPKSWGGWAESDTPYTDVHHLIPADQYVNGTGHSNHALGKVSSPTYTSKLGYKRGPNTYPGSPSTTCFEPIDQYKGYFARMYFYMATRYENDVANWTQETPAQAMMNGTSTQAFTNWAKNMLVEWHNNFPVQDWERARNDSVQKVQNNRNPFIDHPELVNKIWGNDNIPFGEDTPSSGYGIKYILKKDGEVIETKILTIPQNP